jgi:hypothetical protein
MDNLGIIRITATATAILCASTVLAAEPYRDRSTNAKEIAWMDLGMDLVRGKLKDPDSAKFRGVYFHRGATNTPTACGEVNAKNSFGGYSGFERFISAGRAEFTMLTTDMGAGEFDKAWKMLCIDR